jgi:PAS domain S-box-containing protein
MPDLQQMMKRQQVLGDFGNFALRSEDLDEVLAEACRLVGEALGTARAKVLEIQEGETELFVRAGVGWGPNVVGRVRMPMSERSSETFSIREARPVISQDIRKEDRFEVPDFMKDAGVAAMVNVPIFVPGRKPYGLLQVDAAEPREFGQEDIDFLRTYATILGPVIDRLQKIRSLQASEERFRLIVETARDYAIFTTDGGDRIDGWFPGAEAVFGWTAEEAVGQPSSIVFTPEDREAGADEKEIEIARREGSAPNVRWHMRKDGRRVFIEGMVWALPDEAGQVQGFVKIGQDVTQRRKADERLRDSEELRRIAVESGRMGAWRWNTRKRSVRADEVVQKLWSVSTPDQPHPVSLYADLMFPEGAAWLEAAMTRDIVPGEEFDVVVQVASGPTAGRWVALRGRAEHDRPWIVNGVSFDVTEQKLASEKLRENEEQLQVMVAELQHRTRNLIGVVGSIARQTMAETGTTEAFQDELMNRLEALSRVQGLLSQAGEERITIREVVEMELKALGAASFGDRVRVEGADVPLRKSIVQAMALAIHELATNARKYGALATDRGELVVRWTAQPGNDGDRRLTFEWIESGVEVKFADGAAVVQGGGYGRQLIEKSLPYSLKAKTSYDLGPDGLRCTIDLPLARPRARSR